MHNSPTLRSHRALVLAAVIALFHPVLMCSQAVAQASLYTVTDLGNIATNGVSPTAINRSGQVAGSQLSGSVNDAVRWTLGTVSVLTPLAVSQNAAALGINDSGEVCGVAIDTNGEEWAVYWPTTGGIVPEAFGVALAIDAIGDIAGVAGSDSAVEWPVSGPPYYPFYGSGSGVTLSSVRAINNLGFMTGWAYIPGHPPSHLGYLSSVNGKPSTFSIPNMTACFPWGINNSNQIVGYATNANGTCAFLWQPNKASLLLPPLKGGTSSGAYGINDQGIIVGWASDSAGNTHAVAWMPDVNGNYTTVSDLNELVMQGTGWDFTTRSSATGINALGQIVGIATFKGATDGFVLTPITDLAITNVSITAQKATMAADGDLDFCAPNDQIHWDVTYSGTNTLKWTITPSTGTANPNNGTGQPTTDFVLNVPPAGKNYLTHPRPPLSFVLQAWLEDASGNLIGTPVTQTVNQSFLGQLRQEYVDHPLAPHKETPFHKVPNDDEFVNTFTDHPELDIYNTGDYDWAIISQPWMPTTGAAVTQAVQNAGLPMNSQFFIGSAYRNPVHYWNITKKPLPDSQHLWGAAIDFQVLNAQGTTTNRTAADYYRYSPFIAPYGQIIWENDVSHVHVQQYVIHGIPNPSVGSLATNPPAIVKAGHKVTITVTLHNPWSPATAPLTINLASSNPAIPLPAGTTVQIGQGLQTVTYTVTAQTPNPVQPTKVTITATESVNGTTKSHTLTVTP